MYHGLGELLQTVFRRQSPVDTRLRSVPECRDEPECCSSLSAMAEEHLSSDMVPSDGIHDGEIFVRHGDQRVSIDIEDVEPNLLVEMFGLSSRPNVFLTVDPATGSRKAVPIAKRRKLVPGREYHLPEPASSPGSHQKDRHGYPLQEVSGPSNLALEHADHQSGKKKVSPGAPDDVDFSCIFVPCFCRATRKVSGSILRCPTWFRMQSSVARPSTQKTTTLAVPSLRRTWKTTICPK